MSHKSKQRGKKLITDYDTSMRISPLIVDEKFNDLLRQKYLDEKTQRKMRPHENIRLDSRVTETRSEHKHNLTSPSQQELPSNHSDEDRDRNRDGNLDRDFNSESSDGESGDSEVSNSDRSRLGSEQSPYRQRIDPRPLMAYQRKSDSKPIDRTNMGTNNMQNNDVHKNDPQRPYLGPKLVDNIEEYVETPEEKRARARDAYTKLQDLVEKYQVKLSRPYTIDSDPNEMEAEYAMHRDQRNRKNQVRFYKQVLLGIVCGAEFLNEKYDPFSFKLKDWSKQIAADMDDYTEVLEEIYEKYKDKGGKFAPEIRLLFMIILSGVTFHLSQTLFGIGGLKDTLGNNTNPNILNKLLGGLLKGGGIGGNDNEPEEAKQPPPDNKGILDMIRKHKENKMNGTSNTTTEPPPENQKTSNSSNPGTTITATNSLELLEVERARRELADKQREFDAQIRQQNEVYKTQFDQLKREREHFLKLRQNNGMTEQSYQSNLQTNPQINPQTNLPPTTINPIVQTLDTKNQVKTAQSKFNPADLDALHDDFIMFENEPLSVTNLASKKTLSANKKSPSIYDELESLESSLESNLSDIINDSSPHTRTPSRKPTNKNKNTTRRNTITSVTRRNKNKTDSTSDILSTVARIKDNIIKL